jgi:hypothetical protein
MSNLTHVLSAIEHGDAIAGIGFDQTTSANDPTAQAEIVPTGDPRSGLRTSPGAPVIWNIPKIRSQLAELGLNW